MNDQYSLLISGNYKVFQEGWNGCGVYMCSGLYKSDTFKLPIYIGSSKDLQYRIESQHISSLRHNNHPRNPSLQHSWNKHGEEKFVWWLIESCSLEERFSIEQNYLNFYRPFTDEFGGFNIFHNVDIALNDVSGEKNPFFGKTHTEEVKAMVSKRRKGAVASLETRRKMSVSGKGRKFSEEHKRKIGEKGRGRKHSEESKRKISEKAKGRISGMLGKKHSEETKKKMRENHADFKGVNHPCFRRKLSIRQIENIREKNSKIYRIIDPNNKLIVIKNLNKFCKDNQFNDSGMRLMLRGKWKQYRGWTKEKI